MLSSAYVDATQIHDAPNVALTRVSGLGSPPPRRRLVAHSERHGGVDYTKFYEPRVIPLAGEAWTTATVNVTAAFDALKEAFALDGGDVVFKFRRIGMAEDEYVTARVADELDWDINAAETFVKWAVTLIAADPRMYAVATKTGQYDPTTAGSGVGIDFQGTAPGIKFPIDFAGTATTHLTVENQGNYPTPPVFTVTGPVTNPIVDNDTLGVSIYTQDLALTSGQTIVIDVEKRTATLAGVDRPDLIDARQTTWFSLVKGPNKLRLRGSGMVAAQTLLQVSFHDARI